MKRSVYFLFASLLLLMACKPKVPEWFIQPDDMEDILYDYHVAQAMARQEKADEGESNLKRNEYFLAVLKKHNVTKQDYDTSMVYYYSHLPRLKEIYKEVNERLSDEAKMLGTAIGETSRYSHYSASGDTANIWTDRTDMLLMPCPMMNRFDFTVKVDTSFYKGDSFAFQFVSEYIWQSGSKDAVVCIVSKYEGDSIIQTVNHVSVSGVSQIRIPANRESRLKEMRGFIYLSAGSNDDATVRRMMFISQMQLIKFHNKDVQNETTKADSITTGSQSRSDAPLRREPIDGSRGDSGG
jgi:hypothetical protein